MPPESYSKSELDEPFFTEEEYPIHLRIRDTRAHFRRTIEETSEVLGVSIESLQAVEAGTEKLTEDHMNTLARFFGLDVRCQIPLYYAIDRRVLLQVLDEAVGRGDGET